MKSRATIALAVAALAAAGCGGSSSSGAKQQVKSAFNTLISDLSNHNPAACAMFTTRYAVENTGQGSYSAALAVCRRHIQSGTVSVPKGLKISKIKVKGHAATVRAIAPGQGSGIFHFFEEGGRWKVDGVTAK
jgi:hypothetical protein